MFDRQSIKSTLAAALLLTIFFVLAFAASLGNSNTTDEVAHTPAGYSYIAKRDMRLNPEHPPLLKDLAGLSVWLWSTITATPLHFNTNHPAWASDVNGQWGWGFDWLFRQGNDADRIVFWARIPMLLLGVLLGWYIFRFGREFFGAKVGLLALFFYAFSPTFLAHTSLVTTDVGASLGFFIAIYYFLKWYQGERAGGTMWSWALAKAGIAFGIAILLKFSTFLLIPYVIILVGILAIVQTGTTLAPPLFRLRFFVRRLAQLGLAALVMFVIGYLLVWPAYAYHVQRYPLARQLQDTRALLYSFGLSGAETPSPESCNVFVHGTQTLKRCPAALTIAAVEHPLTRPWAQYLLGLLMVIQRSSGGNTTYFLGEVSANAWWYYFPLVYLLKETLAFHLLTLLALAVGLRRLVRRRSVEALVAEPQGTRRYRLACWLDRHPAETAIIWFIVLYWAQSISANLNIGIRHVLPTFPFIFLLVSRQIVNWLRPSYVELLSLNLLNSIRRFLQQSLALVLKYALVAFLLIWTGTSAVIAYPHYLPYFNELVGTDDGYRYVVDSNYDWGQDLKRLIAFTEEHNIATIKVYYFGGSAPEYYLGERYEFLYPERGPQRGWIAISATLLQNGRGLPAPDFHDTSRNFSWLDAYEPVGRAGKSIFIYNIP
ncbi:MAG: glycosyltransferase family 39 protein [bacterium]|nr:glycosyltransferase family 39 protein [bacterium]MDZ4295825.1 glycosyltransferase family 39 protein [Patescibacteria group bacterium]